MSRSRGSQCQNGVFVFGVLDRRRIRVQRARARIIEVGRAFARTDRIIERQRIGSAPSTLIRVSSAIQLDIRHAGLTDIDRLAESYLDRNDVPGLICAVCRGRSYVYYDWLAHAGRVSVETAISIGTAKSP